MRFYESIQKFMIFHENNTIFMLKYFAFIQLQCTLLAFAFAISDFELDLKILVLFILIKNFEVSNLAMAKVKTFNIADT